MIEVVLSINPGSTSTKVALISREKIIAKEKIQHSKEELDKFKNLNEQKEYRSKLVLEFLKSKLRDDLKLVAVAGRGGLLKPLKSGTYKVNELMLEELSTNKYGEHASNLGAIIAHRIAKKYNVPAFIVDPPVVDEFPDIARISGVPGIERISRFHALNINSVTHLASKKFGKKRTELNLIVAHLGGGISVAMIAKGRCIDVNNAMLGTGPFSPERAGTTPLGPLVDLCFSGKYSYKDVIELLVKKSGLMGYLGTNDSIEVEKRISNGDGYAKLIYDAMIYQIAKEIGAVATIVNGEVDAIILTGGLAHSNYIVENIERRVKFIAPVYVYPGERELEALAEGAFRVLDGQETALEYK